ncbi:MAG: carboxypeptidase-like regulatory domain-containing protein, partial [Ignavibacteria bacterium]
MKKYLLIVVLLSLSVTMFAQQRGNRRFNADNSIKGRVLDFATKHPLEYANIVLIAKRRNIQAGGTITNSEGYFKLDKLRPGIYKAKISFIGYNSIELDSLFLRPGTNMDLGDILLKAKIVDTEEVIVEGNRSPITYEIDKKVINVSEQITSLSGTAVDVLENVPSVT